MIKMYSERMAGQPWSGSLRCHACLLNRVRRPFNIVRPNLDIMPYSILTDELVDLAAASLRIWIDVVRHRLVGVS